MKVPYPRPGWASSVHASRFGGTRVSGAGRSIPQKAAVSGHSCSFCAGRISALPLCMGANVQRDSGDPDYGYGEATPAQHVNSAAPSVPVTSCAKKRPGKSWPGAGAPGHKPFPGEECLAFRPAGLVLDCRPGHGAHIETDVLEAVVESLKHILAVVGE